MTQPDIPARRTADTSVAPSRRQLLHWLAGAGLAVTASAALPTAASAAVSAEDGLLDDILLIRDATVIDATGAPPKPRCSVLVIGDRIVAVSQLLDLDLPTGVRVVDGRGKYVIPGLWDMHTHGTELERISPALQLVNGVTGIREMFGGYPEVRSIRDRIECGAVLGPRMVVASSIIDGPVSLLGPPVIRVGTPAEAVAAVRFAAADGADFIKVYSYLTPELLAAIAGEAHRLGLPFGGHLPYRVPAGEASDLGLRCFEHLFGLGFATTLDEQRYRRLIADLPIDPANPRLFFDTVRDWDREALARFDPTRAAALFERFRRNGSWHCPTMRANAVLSTPVGAFDDDPRLRYMPAEFAQMWADRHRLFAPSTQTATAEQARYIEDRLSLIGAMHRSGVGVLSGTDCLNPYVYPGFSTHDELRLLVRAGLSPMSALRAATADPARYLGLHHTMGTVRAGNVADLVVLDADPLADIGNTQRINAVVTRGRLLSRSRLDIMLAEVERAAAEPLSAMDGFAAASSAGRLPAGALRALNRCC